MESRSCSSETSLMSTESMRILPLARSASTARNRARSMLDLPEPDLNGGEGADSRQQVLKAKPA